MNGHAPLDEAPFASSSRAVYTLKYSPAAAQAQQDEDRFSKDELWHELYTQAWQSANERISATLNNLHDAALDEIVDFVHASDHTSSSLLSALRGRVLLPTGLVVGASPSSASLLFTALCRQLSGALSVPISKRAGKQPEAPTCLVSRLSSRHCPNIKTALRMLNAGFINRSTLEAFDDDDSSNIAASALKSATLPAEDLENLLAWYTYRFRSNGSKSAGPRLVVLLEDLEGMQGHVLSALVEALAAYAGKLPLAFLIGVATSADAINQVVWRGITSLMNISTFFVEPGIAAFNAVMRDLFIESYLPLSVDARTFHGLLQDFQVAHLSVDATISAVQYLYMFHYASQLVATVTPETALDRLDDEMADSLLKLNSVASLARDEEIVIHLENKSLSNLHSAMSIAYEARQAWHRKRRVGFTVLVALQRFWDKEQPLEKMLMSLHDGTAIKHVEEVCKMTLQAASTKLPMLVAEVIQELEGLAAQKAIDDDDDMTKLFGDAAEQLERIASMRKPSQRQNLINRNVVGHDMITAGLKLDTVDVEFSDLVKRFASELGQNLKSSFRLATSLPMHECWLIQDANLVQKSFHPALLTNVQSSLSSLIPSASRSSKSEAALLDPALDVVIAYKMYCETGRTVNLADWYTAWEGSVWDEMSTKKRKRKVDGKDNQDLANAADENQEYDSAAVRQRKQARFIRAIGDLGFLGFLQPTARKAEHVTKTVF
ncbi:Origin recognition complex subunit 3 [Microbotryomycetes sp. JL201]|nr:Origin recognition complex subunit 3 [Microbotryomycetes sp. JL201]